LLTFLDSLEESIFKDKRMHKCSPLCMYISTKCEYYPERTLSSTIKVVGLYMYTKCPWNSMSMWKLLPFAQTVKKTYIPNLA
jgi:hypothetical protein